MLLARTLRTKHGWTTATLISRAPWMLPKQNATRILIVFISMIGIVMEKVGVIAMDQL
jgi:hypothetical protein